MFSMLGQKGLPISPKAKSLMSYYRKSEGTCKQGERSDLTGCTPASGESSGKTSGVQDDPTVRTPGVLKARQYLRWAKEKGTEEQIKEGEEKLAKELEKAKGSSSPAKETPKPVTPSLPVKPTPKVEEPKKEKPKEEVKPKETPKKETATTAPKTNAYKRPNKALPDESRPDMTPDEKASVASYTDEAGIYKPMNEALRLGKTDQLNPFMKEVHKDLEKVFDNIKDFKKPVKVYRGMDLRKASDIKTFLDKLQQAKSSGGSIVLGGYISTTTDSTVAEESFKGNFRLNIEAIHGLDLKSFSTESGEDELLIDHRSSYSVSDVSKNNKGEYVVNLKQNRRK